MAQSLSKREYHRKHKEEESLYNKKYYFKNREILIKKSEIRNLKNKQKIRYRYLSKKYKDRRNLFLKKKRDENISFRIVNNLRSRLGGALKNRKKNKTTLSLIGCNAEYLKKYLESKFKSGMSWDNYGLFGWHIDHIKPCCTFNLTNPEEQKACFHYTNLQPLWANENLSKGRK